MKQLGFCNEELATLHLETGEVITGIKALNLSLTAQREITRQKRDEVHRLAEEINRVCEDIEDRHETCRELHLKLQRKEQIYEKIKAGNLAEAKNLDLSQSGYWGALKGDLVDEMLARYISDYEVKVPISRIGNQLYMFGTRRIYAKIMNNRLVVRVGGGFMGIDQFVHQHTDVEMQRLRRYTPQQLTELHTPIPEGVPQFTLIG